MLGAIAGDVIGSPYERNNIKTVDFPLLSEKSCPTADSFLTIAITLAIMDTMSAPNVIPSEEEFEASVISSLRRIGRRYPKAGYGKGFKGWLWAQEPHPYNSMGNGAATRVSPVAWAFDELGTVEHFAEITARVTHDHPEGIKGAQAVAGAVFLARTGHTKDDIREYITTKYGYDLSRTIDEIRPNYHFSSSCPKSIPEAITAFLEGENFEDAVRKAVSLGGNSDTIAAIAGAISEAMYGMSILLEVEIFGKLKGKIRFYIERWEQWRN